MIITDVYPRLFMVAALAWAPMQAVLADKVVVYTIDPSQTEVRFTWRDGGVVTSGGVFKSVSGTIWGNQDQPEQSRAEVIMQVKSLDTSISSLNNMLTKSGDFFKGQQFPEVTFKSTAITNGDMRKGMFTVLGTLTVNGISKPVALATQLDMRPQLPPFEGVRSAGFVAKTSFKRSDFGMGKYAFIVSDELKVHIKVQAIESEAYQKIQDKLKL